MFVARNNGAVVGVYAKAQVGYAEEMLPDNDPEVVAFLAPKPVPQRVLDLTNDANVQDLLTRLQTATVSQIDAWLTTNVTTLAQARGVLATIIKFLASRTM